MAYTLWHSGVLIGETDLEGDGRRPGQRSGVFRPTQYGRRVFPLISGILTAAADLKDELDLRGVSPDDMPAREIEELLDSTPSGRKVVDIGRNLSEIEVRDPAGAVLELKSITFIDLAELSRLTARLDCGSEESREAFRADGAPEFIVSLTARRAVFPAGPIS